MAGKKATTQRSGRGWAWVSNYPPLKSWLDEYQARCVWQLPLQPPGADGEYEFGFGPSSYVECWVIPGRPPFIIMIHANNNGWEIYTAGDSVNIVRTLADAELRLGL